MLAVTHSLLEDLPKTLLLTNVLSRGETVLALESGLFALG